MNIFVEVPKGSRNKYEYDPEVGAIVLDRFLFSSMVYPVDYGYLPETMGADGDPLDAMVCVSEPTFPGCIIPSIPIGLFRMTDRRARRQALCVPAFDPNWNHAPWTTSAQMTERSPTSSPSGQPEGKHVDVDGWYPRLRDRSSRRHQRKRTGRRQAGDSEPCP
jgi:inorganic pyrophosphatase